MNNSININDCFDPRSGLVPIAEAAKRILSEIKAIEDSEYVDINNAVGRILADTVYSSMNVPPHSNSAMDGYAVSAKAMPETGNKEFSVVGTALAGKPWMGKCQSNQVVQVMTGAVMPEGTDTVIIQEEVSIQGRTAILSAKFKPGQNVRAAGEDIEKGTVALSSGEKIGAAEMGVLASIGTEQVRVIRKPVAAIFSTGDELKVPGQSLEPGNIYDSNRYVLVGLLQQAGLEVSNLGIIPDNPERTMNSLANASKQADVIITSGGVSTGSADYVINALQELGEINLWRIALRPGRPFAFGTIGNTLFFGLPGNPVAVMVTFYQLVKPALQKLMGARELNSVPLMKAKAISRFRKKPNRTEVYRAALSHDEQGNPVVSASAAQGSGLLSSMSRANCFVLLDDDAETVLPGDLVDVQLFTGLN